MSQSKTNIESFLPGVHAEEAEELQNVTAVRKLCLWILSSPGSKDHAVVQRTVTAILSLLLIVKEL